jgi:hypothetical protein
MSSARMILWIGQQTHVRFNGQIISERGSTRGKYKSVLTQTSPFKRTIRRTVQQRCPSALRSASYRELEGMKNCHFVPKLTFEPLKSVDLNTLSIEYEIWDMACSDQRPMLLKPYFRTPVGRTTDQINLQSLDSRREHTLPHSLGWYHFGHLWAWKWLLGVRGVTGTDLTFCDHRRHWSPSLALARDSTAWNLELISFHLWQGGSSVWTPDCSTALSSHDKLLTWICSVGYTFT